MKSWLSVVALLALLAPSLRAADGLSGAWTAGAGPGAQTFVFKAQNDGRFTGIVCGPCDDPSAVFRIEEAESSTISV